MHCKIDSLYCSLLQEYEGLTNKIHELQLKQQELQESITDDDDLIVSQNDEQDDVSMISLPNVPNNSLNSKSPMRNTVKCYLPNKQISSVSSVCLSVKTI